MNSFLLVLISWVVNIICLILYLVFEEINPFAIISITGVILTGVVPVLLRKKDEPEGFSIRRAIHVVVGIVGTVGTGLLLGYSIEKKQEYMGIALIAALAHILSGTIAHIHFVKNSPNDSSLAYTLFKRNEWYFIITIVSIICTLFILFIGENATNDVLQYISPIIHAVAFGLLIVLTNENLLQDIFNYTILHTAAVVSVMGIMLSIESIKGIVLNSLVTAIVYLYLALVHL